MEACIGYMKHVDWNCDFYFSVFVCHLNTLSIDKACGTLRGVIDINEYYSDILRYGSMELVKALVEQRIIIVKDQDVSIAILDNVLKLKYLISVDGVIKKADFQVGSEYIPALEHIRDRYGMNCVRNLTKSFLDVKVVRWYADNCKEWGVCTWVVTFVK